jgi:succinate dehydrogenase / fumarate reductase cytochrome b subunit
MNFLFSSIGRKIQIAISGLFFAIFLFFHLLNNLVLFAGEEAFNQMVGFLESIKPIIRIMEFALLGMLLMHVINAFIVSYQNKKASAGKYAVSAKPTTASLNSRTMLISGSIILVFFIIHLRFLWYTFQTTRDHNYFQILLQNKLGYLGHLPTALFYIIAISFISFHLKHGFLSSFKSLGFPTKLIKGPLAILAFLFWGIIPMLFILIIVCIQIGYIN